MLFPFQIFVKESQQIFLYLSDILVGSGLWLSYAVCSLFLVLYYFMAFENILQDVFCRYTEPLRHLCNFL